MAKHNPVLTEFGANQITNGDFSEGQTNPPGTFTSNDSLPGWTNSAYNGVPIEVIHEGAGSYHMTDPSGHNFTGFVWDSLSSPGAPPITEFLSGLPGNSASVPFVGIDLQVGLQTVGSLHTSTNDALDVLFNGQLVGQITAANFTTSNHLQNFHFDAVQNSANPDGSPTYNSLTLVEVGPDVHANVGFAATSIAVHPEHYV